MFSRIGEVDRSRTCEGARRKGGGEGLAEWVGLAQPEAPPNTVGSVAVLAELGRAEHRLVQAHHVLADWRGRSVAYLRGSAPEGRRGGVSKNREIEEWCKPIAMPKGRARSWTCERLSSAGCIRYPLAPAVHVSPVHMGEVAAVLLRQKRAESRVVGGRPPEPPLRPARSRRTVASWSAAQL